MTSNLAPTALELMLDTSAFLFVKSSIVLGAGLASATLVRRSPARCSTIWTVVVVALLSLPLLRVILPPLDWAVLEVRHDVLQQSYGYGGLSFPLALWLVILWIAGTALFIVRLVRDFHAARGLVRRSMPLTDNGRIALLARAARDVGCKKLPVLRETAELSTAALIGWKSPTILLPVDMSDWTEDEVVGVLSHELEHVRRNDWVALMAERFAAAIYWPNPLVHIAVHAASGAREQAADDAVFRGSVRLETYVARLISIARGSRRPLSNGALTFSSGADIDARVRALFAQDRDRRPVTDRLRMLVSVAVFPVILLAASLNPWSCVPGVGAQAKAQVCD